MVQMRQILMLKKIANLARTEQEVACKYGCRISVSVKISKRRHIFALSQASKIHTGKIGRIPSIIFNIDVQKTPYFKGVAPFRI